MCFLGGKVLMLSYVILTFSAGGATGLDFPDVVLSYSVEVEGLGYVVGSHGCKV